MNVKGYNTIIFLKYNYHMKNTVFLDNKHITNTRGICFYISLMAKIMEKKNLENTLESMFKKSSVP